MKLQIKNRWTSELIVEGDFSTLAELVCDAVRRRVSLRDADLQGADLSGIAMQGADLSGAALQGANLSASAMQGANLQDAAMQGANLSASAMQGANLQDAAMQGANLSASDLQDAAMQGADLRDANLRDAKNVGNFMMRDGIMFLDYLSEVVPALLTAGGKSLKEVLSTGCWQCHTWDNCPMHAAFGIDDPKHGPSLLRGRITEFVQFFDAGLIPEPKLLEK